MRVVFRADASVTIGNGHVMRCLTLADELRARGSECRFVTRRLQGHLGPLIEERGYPVVLLDAPPNGLVISGPPDHASWAGVSWERDMEETRAAIAGMDWLIVDHYAFDARWQHGLADGVGQIMVIDDLADRPHTAALLLDQNLGRESCDYDGKVPDDCRRLIGPSFALLRPEFAAIRGESLERRKDAELSHLMVSMGGTDTIDATSTVLHVLAHANLPGNLRISVVMGKHAPALERVRALATQMPWPTEVLVDVRDMAALMADADLIVGAGGSTIWECCCLGLPGIIVETAANQAGVVAAMTAAGVVLGTGPLSAPEFGERFKDALGKSLGALGVLSARMARICSGDGASQVADLMFSMGLRVRLACPKDAENIWHWRNDGAASDYYLNPNPTPLADHLAWFESALNSSNRVMLVIEVDGIPAGHVRLDRHYGSTDEASVSIYLNPLFRGQGLGSKVLKAAISSSYAIAIECLLAQVHVGNRASQKVFERVGFKVLERHGDFLKLMYSRPRSEKSIMGIGT